MNAYRVCRRPGRRSGAGLRCDAVAGGAASAMAMRRGPARARAVGGGREQGFSLIEIILVVVLIGGIVAFAATRILGGGDRANVNLARAQVQTLAGKVDSYEMDTGRLPGSLADLVSQPSGVSGWLGPYARQAELNDPWGTPFEYRVPGDGRRYDIISYGADRQPGGDSVNADIRLE